MVAEITIPWLYSGRSLEWTLLKARRHLYKLHRSDQQCDCKFGSFRRQIQLRQNFRWQTWRRAVAMAWTDFIEWSELDNSSIGGANNPRSIWLDWIVFTQVKAIWLVANEHGATIGWCAFRLNLQVSGCHWSDFKWPLPQYSKFGTVMGILIFETIVCACCKWALHRTKLRWTYNQSRRGCCPN